MVDHFQDFLMHDSYERNQILQKLMNSSDNFNAEEKLGLKKRPNVH
jgi:hypothetical protein